MIDIVKRHAVKLVHHFRAPRGAQYFGHRRAQGPVFPLQSLLILAPCRLVQSASLGPRKKIAALQLERATPSAYDSAPHGIFPVRGMQHHLPDVVPARTRAPCGLLRGESLDGLLEVRSMPSLFVVGFVEQREHQVCGIHRLPHGPSVTEARKAWRALSFVSTPSSLAVWNSSVAETERQMRHAFQMTRVCKSYRTKLVLIA